MTGIGKKCGDPPHDQDFQKFACQKGVSTVEILRMTVIFKETSLGLSRTVTSHQSVEILRMTGISKVTSYQMTLRPSTKVNRGDPPHESLYYCYYRHGQTNT